ncbi:DUF4013 domain-containing protein [uncultured Methanobrevibacter sp.]|uniref:DUF4013 domain-containing protein n=1 Tax=uncultured Methanobrevibacter sp. TaxID=253161 RepID=UPI002624F1FA|nr:DUF4013 domain-containing protein [uncultured Methanobrevibacter sp.]
MNISEIISDALVYPLNNIKAVVIYMILGIIAGIAIGGTVLGIATGSATHNALLTGGTSIIGVIISVLIILLIAGYELDIVKYGINRDPGAPGIDIVRQVVNAIKVIIVSFVYYLVPVIIAAILRFLLGNGVLTTLLVFIITVVFALAQFMAKCRLAKTDSLGEALAFGEAIGDISRVGIVKLLATVIIIFVIVFVVIFIAAAIANWNNIIGGILIGILAIYLTFFANRATGLLYSDA